MCGNAGDDEIHGDDGSDVILGGSGSDRLFGGAGDDFIHGSGAYGGTVFPTKTNSTPPAASGVELARGGAAHWSRPGLAVGLPLENSLSSAEPNFGGSFNHSQKFVTDALALYAQRAANVDSFYFERRA